jgi:hypothetical protein
VNTSTVLPHPGTHLAAFYQTDRFFIEQVAAFVRDGLAAGEQVIVLATLSHWNAIAARLEEGGIAYGRAASQGRLVLVDAEHVLETITIDGRVSVEAFRATLKPLITAGEKLRMYGELVSLLAQHGDVDGAVALEALGTELAKNPDVSILCGYHAAGHSPLNADDIQRIQKAHDRSVFEGRDEPPPHPHFHAVRFYENRDSLARIVGQFLGEGFAQGLPAIVIATPQHRDAIRHVLAGHYFDVSRLEAGGNLIMVDAEELLARFMLDGVPDARLFTATMVPLIEQASQGRDCVIRAYGEMVDLLWKAGQTAAAVRLETLWNQLAHTHAFALLCGYSMGNFYKDAAHEEICRHHTHLVSESGQTASLQ